MISKLQLMLCGAVALALGGTQVYAQDALTSTADASKVSRKLGLEEVIVTAERRATTIQETALQISALGSQEFERQPLTDLIQLSQRQPELIITQSLGIVRTAIRGVGASDLSTGADPRVAFHTDGVYVARGAAQAAGLYDIARMEIVQGPQGTLYGRNATGGALNVITAAPTSEFTGYVNQTFGNYDLIKSDAAINLPVNDQLAVRLAGQYIDRGGYGEDIFLHHDIADLSSKAFRARARLTHDRLQVDLIADFYRRRDFSGYSHTNGFLLQPTTPPIYATAVLPSGKYDNSADWLSPLEERTYGFTLIGKYELTDHLTFQSLSGYRDNDWQATSDTDGTNVPLFLGGSKEESETFSQEFQLNGDFDKTKFTLGAYGFGEDLFGVTDIALANNAAFPPPPAAPAVLFPLRGIAPTPNGEYFAFTFNNGHLKTRTYALFGQVTQDLGDKLKLTAGGRYSWERKEVDRASQGLTIFSVPLPLPQFDDPADYKIPGDLYRPEEHKTWKSFTPRLSVQYDFTPDLMGYVTFAKGFKSGAYGLADAGEPIDPEKLQDYEGGLKATLWGGRLLTNISAFYYDYKDIQVNVLESLVLLTKNAAKATIYGGQLTLEGQVTDQLKLGANATLLHSEFDEFMTADTNRPDLGIISLEGLDLPQAPAYRYSFSADYSAALGGGELDFHVQSTTTARYYFTAFNLKEISAPPATNVDTSISYSFANGWKAALWCNNVLDKTIPTSGFAISPLVGNVETMTYSDPRTYGVTVAYKW